MVQIRLCAEGDLQRWDEYVNASQRANCYHQAGWKSVIERSFGVPTRYLLAEDASQSTILGVLPLALLSSVAFGRFMVSLPYFNYGGVCASNAEVQDHLLQRAVEIARAENVAHLELRHTEPEAGGLAVKASKVAMRLELPSTSEDLWKSLASKVRQKVRGCQKQNITARVAKAEALSDFYDVFATIMRDLGTPVYSRAFFANILREFPDSTWICSVYQGLKAVGSLFLVGFKDRVEIPWGGSPRTYDHLGPNMLLHWTALSFACDQGYRVFDFGRCTPGSGPYEFKQRWGTKPVPLYWHYWLKRGGPLPDLNPRNPKYALAVRIWKQLPLKLTTAIGPSIVKSLP